MNIHETTNEIRRAHARGRHRHIVERQTVRVFGESLRYITIVISHSTRTKQVDSKLDIGWCVFIYMHLSAFVFLCVHYTRYISDGVDGSSNRIVDK